jgi:hypothetical protein
MNKVLWALDRGRGAARAVSLVAVVMVVLGAAASGGPPLRPDPQLTPGATLEVTTADMCVPGYTKQSIAYVIMSRAKISATFPLTRNRANNAIVRSTISFAREMIIDLRLKRPNQCLWRQWFRSMPSVWTLLMTSLSEGNTAVYACQ